MKTFIRKVFKRTSEVWKESGWRGPLQLVQVYLGKQKKQKDYLRWIEKHEKLNEKSIRGQIENFDHKPLISIILPVYNVDEKWLRICIDSVLSQLYTNWELCIADDASTAPHIPSLLKEYSEKDDRIRLVMRLQNGHISAASNSALVMASGEWVVLLDHDDELTPDALFYVVKEINDYPQAQLIYSDEDLIDERGARSEPKFKPDWSPDLFYSLNLVTHLSAFRAELIKKIDGFRLGFEGSQDYDLTLRAIEQIDETRIRHIPKILYHWRTLASSVASNSEAKPYAHNAARAAIGEHFERKGINAVVIEGYPPLHRAVYELPDTAKISLIFNGNDEKFGKINFGKNVEVINIGSEKTSLSERFNAAAKKAAGDVLVFVENDVTDGISETAIKELSALALQEAIGAVGNKWLYRNGTIHRGGIILGLSGVVIFAYRGMPRWYRDSLMRAQVINNFSAVSGASLVTRRDVFEALDGFDTSAFPGAFYDIDYCLRVREKGYRVAWTPHVEFTGDEKTLTEKALENKDSNEVKKLLARWQAVVEKDPYCNPNLANEEEPF